MTDADRRLAQFLGQVGEHHRPLPREGFQHELVVHEKDLAWFEPPDNPARLAPVLGSPMKSFELFLQEYGPGATSDMQRHHHEAVHYVISGIGHSEIGRSSYPWAQGDFVCVPPMMWHRHYNDSETEPVRMLLIENSRLLESLGLNFRESVGMKTLADLG